MKNKDKEVDEKLYKVVKKSGSHINTKVNPDGTISAIQFTDNGNNLSGPLELIEVKEGEYRRIEKVRDYSEKETDFRTWNQIIIEDIVVPVARETIEQLLDIGLQCFEVWMEKKAIPATKQKVKKIGKDISIFHSAMKSDVKGEQPKALQILEEEKKKTNTSIQSENNIVLNQSKASTSTNIEITQAEYEQLIAIIKKSAVTLAGCINLLKNSVISDMDDVQKIEFERQLKELTTEDIMTEINLLLDDKNKGILDSTSYVILSAFRNREFIIDGEKVSFEKFLA